MRLIASFLLVIAATCAFSDRLISVPTGRKLPYDSIRFDYTTGFEGSYKEAFLGLGIGKSFELDFRGEKQVDFTQRAAVDFAFNYIAPIADLTPGISVGMQDASDSTPDGRRFYLALTSKQIYSTEGGDVAGDVTLGGFFGNRSSVYVGLNMPLSRLVRLLAEHNGYRIGAGLEVRPSSQYAVRFLVRDHTTEIAVTTTKHF